MTKQPLVSIMILGWNNYGDVINCLKTLKKINYHNYNIVLVDNGSQKKNFDKFVLWLDKSKTRYGGLDNSVSKVRTDTSKKKIFIIKNNRNLGFTGGSNLGLRFTWKICSPKYLLLLNGDTLVTKDFLTNLVKSCEKDKKIGSAQSLLIRFDKKTIDSLGIEMVGHRAFDSGSGKSISILSGKKEIEEIFCSCGASALYRADLIKKIGLFDNSLFATYEDFDLGWRIRLAGYSSILVTSSVVYHRGGVSRFRKDHVTFDMRSYYGAKNALVLYNRYYPITIFVFTTCLARFGLGIISALKNHRTREFMSIIHNFPNERRKISKHSRLRKVQKEWIK